HHAPALVERVQMVTVRQQQQQPSVELAVRDVAAHGESFIIGSALHHVRPLSSASRLLRTAVALAMSRRFERNDSARARAPIALAWLERSRRKRILSRISRGLSGLVTISRRRS